MRIPTPEEFAVNEAEREDRDQEEIRREAAPFLEAVEVSLLLGYNNGIKPVPNCGNVREYIQQVLAEAGWRVKYYEGLGHADLSPLKKDV